MKCKESVSKEPPPTTQEEINEDHATIISKRPKEEKNRTDIANNVII